MVQTSRQKAADAVLKNKPADKRLSEHDVASKVQEMLAGILSPEYEVHQGRSILYRIEVDPSGKATHGSAAPRRGKYAFQTDILVAKGETPLVVVELEVRIFLIARCHHLFLEGRAPQTGLSILALWLCRDGVDILGRRFLTHNEGFDFAAALPNVGQIQTELVPVIRRQIASAESIIETMHHSRLKLRRFEQNVEVCM
jgi:hypothetical protein